MLLIVGQWQLMTDRIAQNNCKCRSIVTGNCKYHLIMNYRPLQHASHTRHKLAITPRVPYKTQTGRYTTRPIQGTNWSLQHASHTRHKLAVTARIPYKAQTGRYSMHPIQGTNRPLHHASHTRHKLVCHTQCFRLKKKLNMMDFYEKDMFLRGICLEKGYINIKLIDCMSVCWTDGPYGVL